MTLAFRDFNLLLCAPASLREASAVDFEKDIFPILEENCLDCHGPD